jgi:hypothetical protein
MRYNYSFKRTRAEKLTVTLELPSTEAFTQYLVDVSPVIAALLTDQPPVRQFIQAELASRLGLILALATQDSVR